MSRALDHLHLLCDNSRILAVALYANDSVAHTQACVNKYKSLIDQDGFQLVLALFVSVFKLDSKRGENALSVLIWFTVSCFDINTIKAFSVTG